MLRSCTSALWVVCAAVIAPSIAQACWDDAGARYGVSPQLLYAVARTESDLNPAAVNLTHRARTKSYDIGLMQINSSHLPALARIGISERDLYEPCTNIMVGAWLLAGHFARQGVSWESVGAYNASCTQLKGTACRAARSTYAWRVYRRLPGEAPGHRVQAPANPRPGTFPAVVAQPVPFILSARVTP
ncbi:MAG: lytic transglycosylase domain-containing protein [Polyangiaceae bacterium]|jgi:soluble lytic murein transglycosylase-like protein|nr:lytic transglycosylase domain-containing protein [Polyangiaceae bacterium]